MRHGGRRTVDSDDPSTCAKLGDSRLEALRGSRWCPSPYRAKPTPRQHEYLLLPNGTDNATDAVGVSGDWDLLNGDSISFSIDVATGDQTGKCEVTLQAMVQTLGGHTIDVSQQSMSTQNEKPLPSKEHLGGWAADCGVNTMEKVNRPDEPVEMKAGTVQISAEVVWPERCAENMKKGAVVVQYRHLKSTDPGEYTNVTSVERAEAGKATALNQSVNLSKTGDYRFSVVGVLWEDYWDWECRRAIAGLGLGIAGALLATQGTILWVALAGIIIGASGAGLSIEAGPDACGDEVKFSDHYEVLVKAGDYSTEEELLGIAGV